MKNLWPDKFEENELESAKAILEDQAKLLPKLTEDLIYASVSQLGDLDAIKKLLRNQFNYRFDINGKFVKNYTFNVLCFSHDITLYPVKVWLDDGIAKELKIEEDESGSYNTKYETPEEFETFVGKVLKSTRLNNIIGSLLRLSH